MNFSSIFFLAAAISTLAADPDPVQTCKTSCKGTDGYFCSLPRDKPLCQCPTDPPHLASQWKTDDGVNFVCGSLSSTNDATETDVGKCRVSCFNKSPTGDGNFCQPPKGECKCPTSYAAAQTSIDSGSFCGATTCKSGCIAKGRKWFCWNQNDIYCATSSDASGALDMIKNKNYLSCELASYPGEPVSFDIRNMCATEKRYAKSNYFCAKAGSCIGYQALDTATLEKQAGAGYACGSVQSGTAVTTTPPPDRIQSCMKTCTTYTYFCPILAARYYCRCPTNKYAVTDEMEGDSSDVFGCALMQKVPASINEKTVDTCIDTCFHKSVTGDTNYCYGGVDKCNCPPTKAKMQKAIDDGDFCGILTCQSSCRAKDDEYFCKKGSKGTCVCLANFDDAKTSITGDDHLFSCELTAATHKAIPEGRANDCAQSQKKEGKSYYCVKTADDCQGFTEFPATLIQNLLKNNYTCGSVTNSWTTTTTTTTTTTVAPDPIQKCKVFCPPENPYFCAYDRKKDACPCPKTSDRLTQQLNSSVSILSGCGSQKLIPDTLTVNDLSDCIKKCFGQTSTGNISYCYEVKDDDCQCPPSIDETQKGIDDGSFCGVLSCPVGCLEKGDEYFCRMNSNETCACAANFKDAKDKISGDDHFFSCELAEASHEAIPSSTRVKCAVSKKQAGDKYFCAKSDDDCHGFAELDGDVQTMIDDGYACGSVAAKIVCQTSCREQGAKYFCNHLSGDCVCETDGDAVITAVFDQHIPSCQATDASVAVIGFEAMRVCVERGTKTWDYRFCQRGQGAAQAVPRAYCHDSFVLQQLDDGASVGYYAAQ